MTKPASAMHHRKSHSTAQTIAALPGDTPASAGQQRRRQLADGCRNHLGSSLAKPGMSHRLHAGEAEGMLEEADRRQQFIEWRLESANSPMQKKMLNTIQCGDATNILQWLAPESVDMVITSPPYYQQRKYNGNGMGIGQERHPDYYLEALMEAFAECVRVVKPTGSIVYNLGDKYLNGSLSLIPFRFAIMACERFDVRLINEITWVKRNPTPRQFDRRLVSSTEPFFHFARGDGYYYDRKGFFHSEACSKRPQPGPNFGQRYRKLIKHSDVLTSSQKQLALKELEEVIEEVRKGETYSFRMKINGIHAEAFGGESGGRKSQMQRKGFTIIRMKGEKIKRDVIEHQVETLKGNSHTAIFPLTIIREMIRLLCPPEGIVVDPYVGSGTTAVAAVMEKRRYLGIDIDPDYCVSARNRIQQIKDGKNVV